MVLFMEHYLNDVNNSQRKAVEATKGPLLVLAGAGAGKTRTIAYRILHLVREGVPPERILAITFTNKAAREMRERIRGLLSSGDTRGHTLSGGEPFATTFHAFSASVLRLEHDRLGYPKQFTIFDRGDSVRAVKRALEIRGFDPKQWEPRAVLSTISKAKGDGLTPSEYREKAGRNIYMSLVGEVWEEYDHILFSEKAMDFDDLLAKTSQLFTNHPDVLDRHQKRFEYIHVDEYQDTNTVQCAMADMLARPHRNICVVGDIDQNIYSWRGASIQNVFDFEKTYPERRLILLEENYRSTKTIVHVSNKVIEKNINRKKKTLYTHNEDGERITFLSSFDESGEATRVAEEARLLISGGIPPSEIAVLYRANFQSRVLEEAFLSLRVPYQVIGTRFFERREVKDVLSYIRAAMNPESLTDTMRIINVPARGIGKTTTLKIAAGKEHELPPGTRAKIADFRRILENIRKTIIEKKPSEAVKFVIQTAGFEALLRKGGEEEKERLENMRELASLAARFDATPGEEGMVRFLEEAALAADQDEITDDGKAVRLMTIHAAKGLEFSHVFITGMEEGLFPHDRADGEGDPEEERRLFYVALTRAKKKLYLSMAGSRTLYGNRSYTVPSSFLGDIDDEFIEESHGERAPTGKVIYLDLDE